MMFGDIFHGAILFIVASYLCLTHDNSNSIIVALKPLRYLLLLMGFFSFYCGIIYNDFTSIPLQIFGDSCIDKDCVYPIGVDPRWYMGKNELTFMNSLKMKLAVIFGVL